MHLAAFGIMWREVPSNMNPPAKCCLRALYIDGHSNHWIIPSTAEQIQV